MADRSESLPRPSPTDKPEDCAEFMELVKDAMISLSEQIPDPQLPLRRDPPDLLETARQFARLKARSEAIHEGWIYYTWPYSGPEGGLIEENIFKARVAMQTAVRSALEELREEEELLANLRRGQGGGGGRALINQCQGITRSGTRCTATVAPGEQWCYNHHPSHAEERRRNASRAGSSAASSSRELLTIRQELAALYRGVFAGEVDRGVAAVAAQVQNVRLRALEVERRVREVDELEAQVAELERRIFGEAKLSS